MTNTPPPTRHLIFVFADHFEPRSPEQMRAWTEGYPRMADPFRDAEGRPPRHTWFYDGCDPRVLDALGALARSGYGEVELHLHHSRDTAASLAERLEETKALYARHGALVCAGPAPRAAFGVVHGKWSLCNSRGDEHCGVNEELGVLRRAGCYADFTFPAWGRMNPSKKNSIYYAADAPGRPKGYDQGEDAAVGRPPSGDLMIFQGPGDASGVPDRLARHRMLLMAIDALWLTTDITDLHPPTPRRVDRWAARCVGVKGRPEWVFVKAQTHGARPTAQSACCGEIAARFYGDLVRRYNDGERWRLWFATAREAYNMVKAAMAGRQGPPGDFKDYEIPPYQNTQ